jgi:hypothetical protein
MLQGQQRHQGRQKYITLSSLESPQCGIATYFTQKNPRIVSDPGMAYSGYFRLRSREGGFAGAGDGAGGDGAPFELGGHDTDGGVGHFFPGQGLSGIGGEAAFMCIGRKAGGEAATEMPVPVEAVVILALARIEVVPSSFSGLFLDLPFEDTLRPTNRHRAFYFVAAPVPQSE